MHLVVPEAGGVCVCTLKQSKLRVKSCLSSEDLVGKVTDCQLQAIHMIITTQHSTAQHTA
jgi:hypothetical protein